MDSATPQYNGMTLKRNDIHMQGQKDQMGMQQIEYWNEYHAFIPLC